MDVKLVKDSTAILSMRESDFDAYSAYGEVVDNSIQADAKKIKIRIFSTSRGGRSSYEVVKKIAFGDDGEGMPAEVLHQCMQLGYSTRFNDRSGIGRFGVGMTLAAINQCQKVDIYSKTPGGKWLWTYIDLEEISSDPPKQTTIPNPSAKLPPKDCEDLINQEKGTLVIWQKYDRQPETVSKIIEKMHVWFGRTYRYFLWDGIDIKIDDELVKAIDPLYLRSEKTRFPDDPPGEKYEPIKFLWPTRSFGFDAVDEEDSEIMIKISLIHESLRPNQGAGNAKKTTERYIHMNQGVSILRNRREVSYGPIPFWPGKSDWFNEKDRWWGCEISFEAVLDRAFTVKNIKRGAVPSSELKKIIFDKINPTRKSMLDKISDLWNKTAKEKAKEEQRKQDELTTGHEDAEKTAKNTPVDKSALDKNIDFDDAAKHLADDIKSGQTEEQKAAWIAKWKGQPFTIEEDSWRGPNFIEAIHLGGRDVIKYNMIHPFFEQITKIIDDLEERSGEYENAMKLKKLIDLLLISYSKAEAKFEPDTMLKTEQLVDNMRLNWGQYLQSYLQTWLMEDE